MYWALIHLLAEQIKPRGEAYSADQWHLWAKSRFLGCVDHILPSGKTITLPNSTAALDVAEFSAYFEQVQAWAAERDVYLADRETA